MKPMIYHHRVFKILKSYQAALRKAREKKNLAYTHQTQKGWVLVTRRG